MGEDEGRGCFRDSIISNKKTLCVGAQMQEPGVREHGCMVRAAEAADGSDALLMEHALAEALAALEEGDLILRVI
jgi:hypothetical protein